MSKIKISPCRLSGAVSVPPSKSAAHRAIICAALSDGISVIQPVELSNDIKATIECINALGVKTSLDGKTLTVDGSSLFSEKNAVMDCGESGSTLRFMIPVAAAGNINAKFIGHGRLPQRPVGIYLDCLPQKNVKCTTQGGLPLDICGQLESGVYEIPGNVSSQFITGLLLALPLLDGDSEIVLTSLAQSVGYINMTIDIMKAFGVEIQTLETGWKIKGGQKYTARSFTVEGDWSQAAFFFTAAALGGKIEIDNLNINSHQGDKACMELYSRFGANIKENNGNIIIEQNELKGIEIDATDIPDLVPALAVTAALAEGQTVIKGAARLRIKESDRLKAMADGLSRLGADIRETDDGLIINGVKALKGGEVDGYNDHRIVMSMSMAAIKADGDVVISDMESINKSYPTFFEDYKKLGGNADVILG